MPPSKRKAASRANGQQAPQVKARREIKDAAAAGGAASVDDDVPMPHAAEPAVDLNDEADPVGRRIDDVLTTESENTLDVAGFGTVRDHAHSPRGNHAASCGAGWASPAPDTPPVFLHDRAGLQDRAGLADIQKAMAARDIGLGRCTAWLGDCEHAWAGMCSVSVLCVSVERILTFAPRQQAPNKHSGAQRARVS